MSPSTDNLWPLAALLDRYLNAEERRGDGDDRSAEALELGERWQQELDGAVEEWSEQVSPEQFAAAEDAIRSAVDDDDIGALATLAVPVMGVDILRNAMTGMYNAGADFVVAEAADAGAKIKPARAAALLPGWQWPTNASVGDVLASWALAIAIRLGARTSSGLSGEALRHYRPGVTSQQVIDGVREYWDALTDTVQREAIGAGLSRAQNLGKLDTYAAAKPRGWTLELRADERLDENTCGPCRKIDGEILPTPEAAALAYGGAGYLWCEGRERCRGTVRGTWINKTRNEAGLDWQTLWRTLGTLTREG